MRFYKKIPREAGDEKVVTNSLTSKSSFVWDYCGEKIRSLKQLLGVND